MARLSLMTVLFVMGIFIAGCAVKYEAFVPVPYDQIDEAFQAVYIEGVDMGYEASRVNREERFIDFTKSDEEMRVDIRVEFIEPEEEEEASEEEPPQYRIEVKDLSSYVPDEYTMQADLERLGAAIEACCLMSEEDRQFRQDWEKGR